MNREEPNWLCNRSQDAETAEHFVLAQYERERISFRIMADVARERGCFCSKSILDHGGHHSTECTKTQF